MDANPNAGATDVDGAATRLASMFKSEQPGLSTEPKHEENPQVEPETEQQEEPKYKVKVGDEEKDVTIEDLKKGYMMQSDYSKKTALVAEQRKTLEAKQSEIDSQLAEARSLLDLEIENLNSPEMLELKQTNPESYLKEFDKVDRKVKKFEKLKAKRFAEQQEKQAELNKREYEALTAAIPEWLDVSARDKEASEIFSQLKNMGFSDDELTNLSDHRMFVLARKALMFERISTQDLSSKVDKKPPKTVKPSNPEERKLSPNENARRQLSKTGSMKDAAKLFNQMMKGVL